MSQVMDSVLSATPDWLGISQWFSQALRRGGLPAERAKEIGQDLVIRLVEGLRVGTLQIQSPRAYLRTMVRNAVRAELRGSGGVEQELTAAIAERHAAPEQVELGKQWAQALALLERVFVYAQSQRAPRYRAGLPLTWRELLDNAAGVRSLEEIVSQEPDAEQDWERAANRIYQRHRRLRQDLRQAAETMGLAPDERRWALRLLQSLRYSQKSAPRDSGPMSEE